MSNTNADKLAALRTKVLYVADRLRSANAAQVARLATELEDAAKGRIRCGRCQGSGMVDGGR